MTLDELVAEPVAESIAALPFITVIVPVRNEGAFIRRTLDELLGQDYDSDRYEVLVVDGHSTDNTRAIVFDLGATHPNVQLLYNPRRWSSAARNLGVTHARGDLVIVVDGHCELGNRNYLRAVAEAFERSGAACLGRPQPLEVASASPLQRAIAAARASRLGHHPASFIYSSNECFVPPQSVAVAYRRSVFERVGLFDESFDACEDVEFNHRVGRAGLRCFFTPLIQVRYFPRATLPGLFRQMIRYGRGRVRLLCKHPRTFSLPCFVPAGFVLGLCAGPLLALFFPWLGGGYLGVLALYALIVAMTSASIARRAADPHMRGWLPFVFFIIHCGAGAGFIHECLKAPVRLAVKSGQSIGLVSRKD